MTKQNKVSTVCLFFVAALLLVSCKNETRSSVVSVDNLIDFDSITVVERHHLGNDTLNPYGEIHIHFVFPVSSERMSIDSLQQLFVESVFGVSYKELSPAAAVQKYVQSYIDNYITDARIFRESRQNALADNLLMQGLYDEETPISDVFFSYYESISTSIVYNQNSILSYQVKQSSRRGNFISFDTYRNHSINLHTGEQIAEYEIFNAGYDLALQTIFIASLKQQNGVRTVRDLENLGFFGVEEIVPNGNFLLNGEGLTYVFNRGEYSAYQLDAPEIFIPYHSIRSILRRGTVVSKMLD